MAPLSGLLWRHLRVYQIYGANTDVGKTIFATILGNAASRFYKHESTAYLKPVSTGPENEADSWYDHSHIQTFAPSIESKTLIQYGLPCSPHTAAKASGQVIPSDHSLRDAIHKYASARAALGAGWLFIETAGGVHSPGPSGTSQADLYAPLRVPIVLVGDSKLGGISQTIAAYESLKLRGLDVESVLLFQNHTYENHLYLRDYFNEHAGIPVETVSPPPERNADSQSDQKAMAEYYGQESSGEAMRGVLDTLDHRSKDRIARLENMGREASKSIWYPFTQQKLLTPDSISAIDSANGDHFQVLNPSSTTEKPLLTPAFDGSASWWTQGLGHGNPQLTLAAAYAAGRYGHVMFAEAIHDPALRLAQTLLKGMDSPRLTRVFYTDNGSTGCEVAVKMALRAARKRYGWAASEKIDILGLKGSYHGDTIGTMDCSEPSVFNEQVEWYQGKGFWFDYPTVWCREGQWVVEVPDSLKGALGPDAHFEALDGVFDLEARTQTDTYQAYKRYFSGELERLVTQEGRRFGGLMLEPVILGAGGMIMVDPLYQRALVDTVRESGHLFGTTAESAGSTETDPNAWTGLPVVFDEVFTGLYRLGRFSASSFLGAHADISIHAKLLTGGLVPLCTTLASESVFDSFAGESKSEALLHGHSYTAHAVGCQVAVESLQQMQSMERKGAWDWAKAERATRSPVSSSSSKGLVWSMWSADFVERVSRQTGQIQGVWALGSVLAISLRAQDGASYSSKAAARLQAKLREGAGSWSVHSRVLGNVIYLIASQKTSEESIRELEDLLMTLIEK